MKKFCLSYSSGKDCLLAMDRLVQAGNQPVALVTTLSDEINRSWFHGIPISVLEAAAEALDLPLVISHNNETNYTEKVVEALQETKKLGAETVCFGDIDIEQNGAWDRQVALSAGLEPQLPLWQENREALVKEFLAKGYTAIIKTVSKESGIPIKFLGEPLNETFITYLKEHQLDICGENGEYHTLVIDGPLFKKRLNYYTSGIYESPYAYSLIIDA